MLSYILFLIFSPAIVSGAQQIPVKEQIASPFTAHIDRLVARSLHRWRTPGLAIAVIDGQDTFSKVRCRFPYRGIWSDPLVCVRQHGFFWSWIPSSTEPSYRGLEDFTICSLQHHMFQGWRSYFEPFVHILGANYCGQDLDFYILWRYQSGFTLIYITSIYLLSSTRATGSQYRSST